VVQIRRIKLGIQPFKARKLVVVAAIILVSTLLAGLTPRYIPAAQIVENWLSDFRFTELSPPQLADPRIVIATINEDTLATLPYRSPIDRGFLVNLLNHLATVQVRAVGIDILFDQPTERNKDKALKDVLSQYPVPVVVATTGTKGLLTQSQQTFMARFNKGLITGAANLIKDVNDGTVRGLYVSSPGTQPRQFGLSAALLSALGLPVPAQNLDLVYRIPPQPGEFSFKSYPAHTIQFLPPGWLAGKIVLIGADLPFSDRHKTVFSAAKGAKEGALPGVLIHAHSLSQLLDNRRARTNNMPVIWLLLLALAITAMFIATLDTSIYIKGILFFSSIAALWAFLLLSFQFYGLAIPFVAPNLALMASFIFTIAYVGHDDRVQKKFIRQSFSRYLSPKIVDMLIANPAAMKAGGERRELTYIFTDLENFTSLTEKSDPQTLVDLLNEYIDGMCAITFGHDGTVDKIIGDAMCAFFGAPLDQPDHQKRAVACAMELDRFAREFAAGKKADGIHLGITRIGVHSGIATIGNFGGENFFDYTAFGDMVNATARLENANKHLGTRICISALTVEKSPGLKCRPVGNLILKGKSESLAAVEPLGEDAYSSSIDVNAYLAAFKAMDDEHASAIDLFQKIVELNPNDRLSAFHLKRLKCGDTGITVDLGV